MLDKDAQAHDLDIGDLVMIAPAKRSANLPRFALYDGHTRHSYRFKRVGRGSYGRRTYGDDINKTNLSPFNYREGRHKVAGSNYQYAYKVDEKRAPCVLIAKGPFSDEDLVEIHNQGVAYIHNKGLV